MAKTEPQEVMTPEKAADMERQLAEYRQQQANQRARDMRAAATPLIDLVTSDGFKAVNDAMPALKTLAQDEALFPDLGTHLNALRHGLTGVQQVVDLLPADPDAEAPAPAAAEEAATA